jgi:hypothetical protein
VTQRAARAGPVCGSVGLADGGLTVVALATIAAAAFTVAEWCIDPKQLMV